MRLRFIVFVLAVGGCQLGACPSPAGGACDPRDFNCPKDYACALGAEICTRTCDVDKDCWVKVADGCRSNSLPLMTLPDGGTYVDNGGDGFCPETKLMVCLGGYCQREVCVDGGCNYDVYGPSPFKGTRSQGPSQ